jgi:hypothetical protein
MHKKYCSVSTGSRYQARSPDPRQGWRSPCGWSVSVFRPGGHTGYPINPARYVGPRLAQALLPIRSKGKSVWSYAWIPVVGPLAGGGLAGIVAAAAPVVFTAAT